MTATEIRENKHSFSWTKLKLSLVTLGSLVKIHKWTLNEIQLTLSSIKFHNHEATWGGEGKKAFAQKDTLLGTFLCFIYDPFRI